MPPDALNNNSYLRNILNIYDRKSFYTKSNINLMYYQFFIFFDDGTWCTMFYDISRHSV
jgi:hypothetical protein